MDIKLKNLEFNIRDCENKSNTCDGMPTTLTIADTTRCNLNCIMCYRNKNYFDSGFKPFLKRFCLTRKLVKFYSHNSNNTIMDFGLFKKVADETFPYLFSVSLSVAGEPFMNPQFEKELGLIEYYRVKLSMFTNVTLLPRGKFLEKLINNLSELTVSVDAATKKTYEHIRRGSSFRAVMNNINRFNKYRNELPQEKKPKLIFWFTLMKSNIEELPAYIELAHKLGADGVGVCHMIVFNSKMQNESLIRHKQLANKYLEEAKDLINRFGLKIYCFPPLFSCQLKNKADNGKIISLSNIICRFLWRQAFIELNGDVFPCCAANRDGLWMGNLTSQTFREIWNGQRYQGLRQSFKEGNLFSPCIHCYQRLKDYTSDIESIYFPSIL
jgi:radical SAM protein with 4Fe4S-binding SPASM domain